MKKTYLLLLTALCMTGCNGKNKPDDKKIIVSASSVPHAEILRNIQEDVKKEGYELIVREVSDYVTPNMMLDSGDVDANYFQHEPYLNDFNANNGTDLVSAFKVHFEPMGIYTGGKTDKKIIAIPNDTSNKERAMKLLTDNYGEELSTYEIIEAEAQSLPALLQDCTFACINGNYALSSGVTDKCIVTEPTDSETAQTNANLIAVKREYKDYEFVKVLKKCLLTEKTRSFIENKYGSSVKAVF